MIFKNKADENGEAKGEETPCIRRFYNHNMDFMRCLRCYKSRRIDYNFLFPKSGTGVLVITRLLSYAAFD